MIANKIRHKIQKVINKFPTEVTIFRDGLNEFGEPTEKENVCSVVGFYHEGNTQISSITTDKGEVKRNKQKFLMILYDENSKNVKEGDYLFLDDKKYFIKDKGNQNRLNIYFDMLLEE